jgi:hypothetical protein
MVIHHPDDPQKSYNSGKPRTPFWEKAAVLVALALLIVNVCLLQTTNKSLQLTRDL